MFRFRLMAGLSVLFLLTGCVNLEPVGKFADGTRQLSQAAAEFYQVQLETDRELAAMVVDLGADVEDGESAWVTASKTGANLIAESRRNRAAVAALASYAEGLRQYSKFDDQHNIEKASRKLSGNLTRLGRELDIDAGADESALARAFSQLAGLYVDVKRRAVIHERVKRAHPHVETIITTLVKDVRRQQDRYAITRLSANVNRENWFNSLYRDYRYSSLPASQKAIMAMTASRLVADELEEKLAELPARRFLEQLVRTADSCLAAHKAIGDTELKQDAEVLGDFVGDARDLYDSIADIR